MPWAVCDALACTGLKSVWLLLEPTRSERRPDRRSELESDDITTTNGGVERGDASRASLARGRGTAHDMWGARKLENDSRQDKMMHSYACRALSADSLTMSHDIHGGDAPVDDFDLWWGVGPTRNNEEQHHASHLGDMSSGGIGSSTTAPSAATLGSSSRGGGGSGSLNEATATLMGSLWSSGGAPNLEAYGHRHHVHGSQGEDGVHAGSPPPPSATSRRPVWLPPPGQQNQHSARHASQAAGPSSRFGQAVVDDVTVAAAAAAAAAGPSSSVLRPTAGVNSSSTGDSSSSRAKNVEHKLEELAVAITASVLDKLDTGVWEALAAGQQQQQQQQQHSGSRSAALTAAASEDGQRQTEAAVAAAIAPLRSRLAALEEQVSQLTAAAARSSANNGGGDPSRGGRGGSGGVGSGVGLGRGGGGGNAAAAEPMLALNALAQRTGTLEGRHKQVQAKVALLDNAFGPKASDWAQTIKAFLQEREAISRGGGGRAAAAGVRPTGGGGGGGGSGLSGSGNGSKGGKKMLGVDAPVFSPQSARISSRGAGAGAAAGAPVVAAGASRIESAPEVVGTAQGDDAAVAGAAGAAAAAGPGAGKAEGGVEIGCAACAQTQERCSRLEKRVAESERALSLLQSRTAAAATAATAAATTAAADAVRAWEVEESSRRDVAAEKAASADLLGRQQKAAAAAGGGGNWASKASLEKLAGELRLLSERAKDGEDTLALVDHGLKGVRDEVRKQEPCCSCVGSSQQH